MTRYVLTVACVLGLAGFAGTLNANAPRDATQDTPSAIIKETRLLPVDTYNKIVPADVLGTGAWSQALTGDSSS